MGIPERRWWLYLCPACDAGPFDREAAQVHAATVCDPDAWPWDAVEVVPAPAEGAVAITDEMIEAGAREMTTWSGPVPGDAPGFKPYAERLLRAALATRRDAVQRVLDEDLAKGGD
jgi:hypothetical protein